MMDSFRPLKVAKPALSIEDQKYHLSWLDAQHAQFNPPTSAEAWKPEANPVPVRANDGTTRSGSRPRAGGPGQPHRASSRLGAGHGRGRATTSTRSSAGRSRTPTPSGPRSGTSAACSPRSGRADPWDEVVVGLDRMAPPDPVLGPRWFPGRALNFAENLLRHADVRTGARLQERARPSARPELRRSPASGRARLRRPSGAMGVGVGDRVAGFLPNLPETVIAMLAAASMGAVWSSCSPDFGANGVLDRFGQIRPARARLRGRIPLRRQGRSTRSARVREVCRADSRIERVVVVPYLREPPDLDGIRRRQSRWADWFIEPHRAAAAAFDCLPFDHPLYIMYSSGTTGLPKCMVHGAGGTLLQHLKELVLHTDLTPDDRIFYFTTCGWMMWNWLVSSLAAGATVVLYDGAPLAPRADPLGHGRAGAGDCLRDQRRSTWRCRKRRGWSRRATHDLARAPRHPLDRKPAGGAQLRLRVRQRSSATCTSPASAAAPISSPALRSAIRSARSGAASCRRADSAWRSTCSTPMGRPMRGADGELVCTRPFPSMPVPSGTIPTVRSTGRPTSSRFPGVWRHGDWAELTGHEGWSSSDAATPRSTRAASGSARRRSTGRSSSCPR